MRTVVASPDGHTVKKLPAVGPVTVTLRATACALGSHAAAPRHLEIERLTLPECAEAPARAVTCVEQPRRRQRLQTHRRATTEVADDVGDAGGRSRCC